MRLREFPFKLFTVKPVKIIFFVFLLAVLAVSARYLLLPAPTTGPATKTIVSRTLPDAIQQSPPGASPAEIVMTLEENAMPELKVLDEIFQSKNDNDPRMDQVLMKFSDPVRSAIRKKYAAIKPELRNERGTIVFLIGRELSEGRGNADDVQFMKEVLLEKPCFNLADCSKSAPPMSPEEEHVQGINETTAMYPQLMGLRYLKLALQSGQLSLNQKSEVMAALEAAKNSSNPRVAQDALAILQSYSKIQ